jgi:hypothetical protein
MRTEVSVKTTTEVDTKTGDFLISCFADMNEDGSKTPSIYKSDVLDSTKIIDNVSGKEGELMLTYSGDTVGEINDDGELVINPDGDDANKYNKQDENLIYEG